MAAPKSQTARRRDVRRAVPRPTPSWLRTLRQRDVAWAALYVVFFAVVASAVAVSVRDRPSYYVTQTIEQPIVARVQFKAIDTEATERNRDFNQRDVPDVFHHNQDLFQKTLEETLNLLNLGTQAYETLPPDYLASLRLTPEGHALLRQFAEGQEADKLNPDRWAKLTQKMLQRLFNHTILDTDQHGQVMAGLQRLTAEHPRPYPNDPAFRLVTARDLIAIDNQSLIDSRLKPEVVTDFPPPLKDSVLTVIQRQLAPTYYRSDELTAQRKLAALENTPQVEVTYRPDDILISTGQRLTADDLQLLEAEQAAYEHQTPLHRWWLGWFGAVGLMCMLGTGVWAYVFAYSPKIRRNPMRGLALTGLLLACQAAAVLLVGVWPQITLGAVAFAVLLGAMVFAIVYDQRFALTMGLALTVLIVLSLRLPITAAVVMMAGVAVAVAQLAEVRSRSKLVRTGLWSGLAMGVATAVGGLAERSFNLPSVWDLPFFHIDVSAQWGLLGSDIAYTVLAGFAVGLLVHGLLPAIERVFHVTTAMTLKELNDASHPLLQRLAQESAGTYQHSLRIADMTEAAADAIGADGLLCRVGAMYHDIGKINKPQYFIENQGGGPNKH
ncbi:MAG: HDIG domain-containing metalloprotein, partial [Planctomycetota bacterium]